VRPAVLGDARDQVRALRPFVVDDPREIPKEELRVVPVGEGVLAQAVENVMRVVPSRLVVGHVEQEPPPPACMAEKRKPVGDVSIAPRDTT